MTATVKPQLGGNLDVDDGALDVDTANVEVVRWLRGVANVREHQSTGARPVDRLEVDQKALPASRFGPHAGAPRRRDRAV